MAKILIVDDDPDVVEAVSLFLQKDHHEVASAYDREEGMRKIAAFGPDLIILDVMMEQPDDGIAMAQDLRRSGNKKPIIMLTSVGRATGLDFAKDNEMVPVDEFQEKPVEPEKLMAKVKELLARGGAR